jgi:hypothetical protein
MRAALEATQRLPRIEFFYSSATAITEGTRRGTFTDNGTGDFTFTFTDPFGRTPVAVATPMHATSKLFATVKAISTTAVRVIVHDDAGNATDPTGLTVMVVGSDSADGQV